jgi:epsilon-lactone hydrolase
MTGTTGRHLPVPTSVSRAAQEFLSVPPLPPPDYPAPDDVDGWLRNVEETDAVILSRLPDQALPVVVEDRQIAGVPTYVARVQGIPDDDQTPVYLHIHGGALIYGGGAFCRLTTSLDAVTTGMITYGVDYRTAPHHPYPAALDDCLAVYRALLEIRDPQDVFVGGASAGGNLAAALVVRARDEGLPMPAALVLLTPEVDLTESGDSFQTLDGVDNTLTGLRPINLLYANGRDLADPYLSPLFADVSDFPPTFLQAGTRDLFLSNTVRMHRKLRGAGVEAELHVFEAMPHSGFNGAPEDVELSAEVRRFLDAHRRSDATVTPIGRIASALTDRDLAPRQPDEGAPLASILLDPAVRPGAADIRPGDRLVVLTWLHLATRDALRVHPRGDLTRPPTGVFSTRSAGRPNPIGLHTVTVTRISDGLIEVDALEAVDGTPVLDLKPVLGDIADR